MATEYAKHKITIHIVKECDEKIMTPAQIKQWLSYFLRSCDYGAANVVEVTTFGEDGKEIANASWYPPKA